MTWLQVRETDGASLAQHVDTDGRVIGVDIRFADGLYATDRVEVTGGRVVVPLEKVPLSDDDAEPGPPPSTEAPTDTTPTGLDPDAATVLACLDCEWVGLSVEDAIAKAESESREWRDGTNGWEDDLHPGRVTFVVTGDVVTYAFVDDEAGAGGMSLQEGATNPDDLIYVGRTIESAVDLATENGREYCITGRPCRAKLDLERVNFVTADGTADLDAEVVAVTRG